jgi:2-hydroxy-6-oxonona-2,4-dienedioate hydrolase
MDDNEGRYRDAERRLWASLGARPTERRLQLGRVAATVRAQELGEGPLLVFVHGASNAGASWAPLASRLGDFRCVLIDRPGCGLSPRLADGLADMERLDAFADALVIDVLDALDLDVCGVVGTSFGGYFALRGAAAHPDRILAAVVLGWTFGAPIESTPFVMRIAMQPALGRLLTRVSPSQRMVRRLLKQIGLRGAVDSGRFGEVEIAWFRSLLRDTDTMRNEVSSAPPVVTMRGLNNETLLPASLLSRVTAPVLLLWGEEDPMGGAAVARAFVDQLPDAQLDLLPHAGHAPWIDDPIDVADRMRAFLGSHV